MSMFLHQRNVRYISSSNTCFSLQLLFFIFKKGGNIDIGFYSKLSIEPSMYLQLIFKLVLFTLPLLFVQALAELLPSLANNGHRVLIFSQWTTMLDILEWALEVIGVTYRRLDGG